MNWIIFCTVFIISVCTDIINSVPALQQTVPPGGVAVCPLSTVQYTCVADTIMKWRESGSSATATYSTLPPASKVNDTGMAGSFNTVLTDISGNTLTSTATIDSVSLGDDGRNISCNSKSAANKMIQVQAAPSAPSNLAVNLLSTNGNDNEVIILLTWSDNSRCVVVYHVEVTASSSVSNMDTTSQHIKLTLQIGLEYSFRVRGADSINRLGEWSGSMAYTYQIPIGSSGGKIAWIVVVSVIGAAVLIAVIAAAVIITIYKDEIAAKCCQRSMQRSQYEDVDKLSQ